MKNSRINIDLVLKNARDSKRERTLGLFDLSIMGIGAIIGTGILVLTGIVAATAAGPAVIISFLIAGLASAVVGLCYSELTTSIPNSGSAYVYAWVAIGQRTAFLAGWTLLGVYITTLATVANGWTGYVKASLSEININLPASLIASPSNGGIINLPAVLMILLITLILTRGTGESKIFNNVLVIIKLAVILLFIFLASQDVNSANWVPFMPFGVQGIFSGASLVFFTFLGFDALATSAEETKNVQKTLPKAIIISLLVVTVLYILVSLIMTGVVSYRQLNVPESMAYVLMVKGHNVVAQIVSVGAIIGILAVVYAFVYAASNIMMSMSRGGFLPKTLSKLNRNSKSPNHALWLIGSIGAVIAGVSNVRQLATISNVGSLCVFFLISFIVILLRKEQPDLERPFKLPFKYTIPILAMLFCVILLVSTSLDAWITYFVWLIIGGIIFTLYSRHHIDFEQVKSEDASESANGDSPLVNQAK
ncbi:APC family permease [Lentilactobacillus raoultii]|uniref:APC family permease n=1 Tax=Lentilactobacillus raoultii TaxID=1987503 RepID=A0ABW3PNB3_9LACO|nr:amino acid permease [Lentilactobacillus raoultii]